MGQTVEPLFESATNCGMKEPHMAFDFEVVGVGDPEDRLMGDYRGVGILWQPVPGRK